MPIHECEYCPEHHERTYDYFTHLYSPRFAESPRLLPLDLCHYALCLARLFICPANEVPGEQSAVEYAAGFFAHRLRTGFFRTMRVRGSRTITGMVRVPAFFFLFDAGFKG
jgi:hypothetical protein